MGSMFLPSEMSGAEYFSLKIKAGALAGWLARLACHLVHQNVAGSILSWGTYGRQPIDVSHINVSLSH